MQDAPAEVDHGPNNPPEAGAVPNSPLEAGGPFAVRFRSAIARFKWLISGIVAAVVLLGLVFTLLATPLYTASTRIDVTPADGEVGETAKGDDRGAPDAQEYYRTQYALLESRTLAERVVNQLDLLNDPYVRRTMLGLAGDGSLSKAQRDRSRQVIVDDLRRNIAVEPVAGSALVDIAFTSANAAFSAKVANAWARQFIQSKIDRSYASAEQARSFLEGRLGELRERIEQSERRLASHADEDGTAQLAQTQIETMTAALADATADRIAAESAARFGDGLAGREPSGQLSELRGKRGAAAAKYAAMMTRFGPEYPAAEDLRAELGALDQAIEREESALQSAQRTAGTAADVAAYRAASAREQTLRAQVKELRGDVASERRSEVEHNVERRELDADRALYDGMLQRYREIGIGELGSTDIAIVDGATVPRAPSSPNLLANLLVSLLVGLILAFAVVATLMRSRARETV